MTPERVQKMDDVLLKRQKGFTVVLEDVHDPHNISAVLRTCDSVGITEVYTINTVTPPPNKMGKRTSAGARKWVTVHTFTDVDECMQQVKAKYEHIFATHLGEDAVDLYKLDLSGSVALVFGNEQMGLSDEILKYATGNFIIPQMGMVQSLNISVACAVTLYEALRQRSAKGMYDQATFSEAETAETRAFWHEREIESRKR